ncbi:macro domain-containing protein PG1779 [Helicoverpa armigera]|uniref:macro domain-containing protein PG1779 n=1 Tax=Helicoverpa armigera TaxID=29058 RepID=UPI003082E1CE
MLSPALQKVIGKIQFICKNTGVNKSQYCSLTKMAQPKWKIEKEKVLNLTPEERKKAGMYKNKTVVTLDMVDPWHNYTIRNKSIVDLKPIQDDLTEFSKIKIDSSQNKALSQKVSIFKGDITQLEVGAIVNAANSMLRAGGGVDGAIHRAAGSYLQEECNTLGGCPTGEAKISGGYNLPAKYVIHTVGPQDGSAEMLRRCYKNSLTFHASHKIDSIAFPCISTGIYGFPNRLAAHIALAEARQFLEKNDGMDRIIFCLFMPIDVQIYETLMQLYFPVVDHNYAENM